MEETAVKAEVHSKLFTNHHEDSGPHSKYNQDNRFPKFQQKENQAFCYSNTHNTLAFIFDII